jgi:hypothetical protein
VGFSSAADAVPLEVEGSELDVGLENFADPSRRYYSCKSSSQCFFQLFEQLRHAIGDPLIFSSLSTTSRQLLRRLCSINFEID